MPDYLQPLPGGSAAGGAADSAAAETVQPSDFNRLVGVLNGTAGTVGTKFFASNPPSLKTNYRIYSLVTDYGCDPTGAIECSTKFLQAIADAKATGGDVEADGIFAVSATVACILNGTTDRAVTIRGLGQSYAANALTGTRPASTIKWVGAAGGTVVNVGFGAVSLQDINVDCNNGLADIGIIGIDVQSANWRNVRAYDANVWNYKFIATNAGVYGNYFENVTNGFVAGGAGGGCLLDGTNSAYDVATSTWVNCGFTTNGANAALDILSADTNSWFRLSVGRAAGGIAAGANALHFGAGGGQRLGALTNSIFGLDGAGPIVHDAASRNAIYFINYSNGLAAPTGATPDNLMLFGSSSGDTKLGANTAVVLVIGSSGGSFSQPSRGFIVRDTSSPGFRLEKAGVIGYETYIGSDNAHHLSGTGLAANANGKFDRYNGLATAGIGVPPIVASYATTGLVAAVANAINYTPPAAAGSYRLHIHYRPTATGASTSVGVTVTYKDSTGAISITTLPFVRRSTAALAAPPFLNTGADDFYVDFPFEIDNSATAITVSTTGTFTGTTYNLAATLEQVA